MRFLDVVRQNILLQKRQTLVSVANAALMDMIEETIKLNGEPFVRSAAAIVASAKMFTELCSDQGIGDAPLHTPQTPV